MSIGLSLNVMRLYNGRRSFYASVEFGRRRVFVSRWDTLRVDRGERVIRRGREMTWYWGVR